MARQEYLLLSWMIGDEVGRALCHGPAKAEHGLERCGGINENLIRCRSITANKEIMKSASIRSVRSSPHWLQALIPRNQTISAHLALERTSKVPRAGVPVISLASCISKSGLKRMTNLGTYIKIPNESVPKKPRSTKENEFSCC